MLICSDLVEEVWECRTTSFGELGSRLGFLGSEQEASGPFIVNTGLGERFGYDSRLMEFDAKSEMDQGMEESCIHPSKQVVCSLVPFEDVLVKHILPAFPVHFALKIEQESMVVFLFAQTLGEDFRIAEIENICSCERDGGPLVGSVAVILCLDDGRGSAKTVEGKEVVSYVVVEAGGVKENVVVLQLCQSSLSGIYDGRSHRRILYGFGI